MCEYCEKGKSMCNSNTKDLGIELHSANSKLVAYGLDKQGWDISIECNINYCPMCRKEAGRVKIGIHKAKYRHSQWYYYIVPRRLTLKCNPPLYKWLWFIFDFSKEDKR